MKLDRSYSKDEVLEFYLNTVYFGRGAYGIQVASQTYFGKPAAQLTPAEGAVLAALLRSPAAYDPADHQLEGAQVEYPRVLPKPAGDSLAGPPDYLVRQELEELGFPEVFGGVARPRRPPPDGVRVAEPVRSAHADAAALAARVRRARGRRWPASSG